MWEWIFDGIGTEIISLIVGTAFGGAVGYKLGVKNRTKQIQWAGDDAQQKQVADIGGADVFKSTANINSNTKQIQKAGNRAVQTQVGGINDGK